MNMNYFENLFDSYESNDEEEDTFVDSYDEEDLDDLLSEFEEEGEYLPDEVYA